MLQEWAGGRSGEDRRSQGPPGWGAACNMGKSTELGFSRIDLALNLAMPSSVALPQLMNLSESQFSYL